jgi:hypothetical protein
MKRIITSAICLAGLAVLAPAEEEANTQVQRLLEPFNPSIGVLVDAFYYGEDSGSGLPEIKEELPGFGHGHAEEEHEHGLENGFNLREVELYFTGEVDGYFLAEATLAFAEDKAEVETATFETTSLPWGFTVKGGKFFSDFGIVNAQHPHQWNFADQPLIYELALGDHGLNEVGVQGRWTLDTSFHLTVGAEALQGSNERMFAYENGEFLPDQDGPRLGVGWIKAGPDLGHDHLLRFGLFGAGGNHQEIHEETPGLNDYYDGSGYFAGTDLLYRYAAHGDRGRGDWILQAEYFYRSKDLDLSASDDPGAPLGETLELSQDGYYIQSLYGFLPRWRGGLRWEQVGLTNELREPGEAPEQFDRTWRAAAMVDFSPSSFSLLRFQLNNGDYDAGAGRENVWEAYVQVVITLGSHRHTGAHACSGHH